MASNSAKSIGPDDSGFLDASGLRVGRTDSPSSDLATSPGRISDGPRNRMLEVDRQQGLQLQVDQSICTKKGPTRKRGGLMLERTRAGPGCFSESLVRPTSRSTVCAELTSPTAGNSAVDVSFTAAGSGVEWEQMSVAILSQHDVFSCPFDASTSTQGGA